MGETFGPLAALLATDNRATMQLMRQAAGMMGFAEYLDCPSVQDLMRHIDRLVIGNKRFVVLIGAFGDEDETDIIAQIRSHDKPQVTSCPIVAIVPGGQPAKGVGARQAGASEVVFEPFSISDLSAAVSTAATKPTSQSSPIDVMVVEDVDSNRAIIRHLLKELPARRVFEATDGEAALKMLAGMNAKGQFPDVLIVDYIMEPMDGLTLVKEIRGSRSFSNPRVPILMLTFKGSREIVTASQLAGADGFIVKPVSGPTLIRRIRRALAASKVRPIPPAKGAPSKLMDAYRRAYGTGAGYAAQECEPEALTSELLRHAFAAWQSAAGEMPMPDIEATLRFSNLFSEADLVAITIKPPGTIEFATHTTEFAALGIAQGKPLTDLAHVRSRILIVMPVREVLARGEPIARVFTPDKVGTLSSENDENQSKQASGSGGYEAIFLPFGNAPNIEIIYGFYWPAQMRPPS